MREHRRRPVAVGVVATAVLALALALLLFRNARTGRGSYDFLVWNLFLAAVPYGLAVLVRAGQRRRAPRSALALAGVLWLLFLPNAFYIVTDFLHLDDIHGMPAWFDALMIGSFACTGLILGFASLRIMEQLARRLGAGSARALTLGALALTGVGIYLGRALQFNSWDAIVRPGRLAASLLTALADPTAHTRALVITAGIGAALVLAYAAIRRFSLRGQPPPSQLRAHVRRHDRL